MIKNGGEKTLINFECHCQNRSTQKPKIYSVIRIIIRVMFTMGNITKYPIIIHLILNTTKGKRIVRVLRNIELKS